MAVQVWVGSGGGGGVRGGGGGVEWGEESKGTIPYAEMSTFKATIEIIYEMTGSEVSQSMAPRSTFLHCFTE